MSLWDHEGGTWDERQLSMWVDSARMMLTIIKKDDDETSIGKAWQKLFERKKFFDIKNNLKRDWKRREVEMTERSFPIERNMIIVSSHDDGRYIFITSCNQAKSQPRKLNSHRSAITGN